MSMTNPPLPGDEKEAIEAEHMLSAERDALAHMDSYTISISTAHGSKWEGSVSNIETGGFLGFCRGTRGEVVADLLAKWDAEHERIAKEIYEKHYK